MYLAKQTEDQSNKSTWDGDPEGFIRSIKPDEFNQYPLLRGVALYEDTYFNFQQVKDLIIELENLRKKFSDEQDKEDMASLIDFAKTVDMQEHLVFVGD